MKKLLMFTLSAALLMSLFSCSILYIVDNSESGSPITSNGDTTTTQSKPSDGEVYNEFASYINYRAALSNTHKKLTEDKKLTVVYFGGSVTSGYGATNNDAYSWRALIGKWLAKEYPDAEITNINRALGESGTYLGTHRVQSDIISAKPDLLFIEYSINDCYYNSTYEEAASQFETIIREVKSALPDTDIVTILVTDSYRLAENYEGKLHLQAQAHEDISRAYNIPTVHVGRALAAHVKYSNFNWGKYAIDIVHLNNDGYEYYYQVIREFMYNSLFNTDFSKPQKEFVMSDMISSSLFDGDRTRVDISNELLLRSEALGGKGVIWTDGSSLNNTVTTDAKGQLHFDSDSDVFAIKFSGTEISAYIFEKDISWLVSVDGGDFVTVTGASHNPTIFAKGLSSGEHTVRIKLQGTANVTVGSIFTRDATKATLK